MALVLYIFPVAVVTACNTANIAHPFSLSIKIKRMERERHIKIKEEKKHKTRIGQTTIHNGVAMVILNFLTRELSCKSGVKYSAATSYIINRSMI